ncbi:carboxylesterase/lipase family protein [Williamsia sterculiae]
MTMADDAVTAGATVAIDSGVVRGRQVTTTAGRIHAFLNVPFAAPLTGATRFAAPQPVQPWSGERDATEPGPTAPQTPYLPPTSSLLPDSIVPGDEFLNLSVWTPDPAAPGLPVMVWIHGGAFVRGGHRIPTYDGSAFARDGVICVGINYRLGALGFLSLPDAPDNRGLLDQIAALHWVRENIAAFGGDPDRVTVVGESAGAMSIAALLASPLAQGLFRRAVLQSGNPLTAAEVPDARLVAAEYAAIVGCDPTAAALGEVPTDALLAAQVAMAAALVAEPDPARWGATIIDRGLTVMSMFPTVDGTVIDEVPRNVIRDGGGTGVDVLAGATRDEFRFFLVPSGLAAQVTDDMVPALLGRFGLDPATATDHEPRQPGATPGDVLCEILTEHAFGAPTTELVETVGGRGGDQAWQYEFAWPSPIADLRACHALELGFVFDTLGTAAPLAGPNPPQTLADEMHAAWVRFATTGDPGWAPVRAGGPVRVFGESV